MLSSPSFKGSLEVINHQCKRESSRDSCMIHYNHLHLWIHPESSSISGLTKQYDKLKGVKRVEDICKEMIKRTDQKI